MKFLPADIIPSLWLRRLACLFATASVAIDLHAACPPGKETNLSMSDLEVKTKTVSQSVCLEAFTSGDVNDYKRYRKQTTVYNYNLSLTKNFTEQEFSFRDSLSYSRTWTKTETLRNDGTIATVTVGSGRGNETYSSAETGEALEPYEKNYFTFRESETGISGIYTHSSPPCVGPDWVNTTQPYTSIWPGHFPSGGFVLQQPVPDKDKLSRTLTWEYQPGPGETGSGSITQVVSVSNADTFAAALARKGGFNSNWEPSTWATAQWGIPGEPNVTCIPGGTVCRVRALFKGCPGEYEARLYVFSKSFSDPNASWSTTSQEEMTTFSIGEAGLATGQWISLNLPFQSGTLYKADAAKGIIVKRIPPAGEAGGKSCDSPRVDSAHFDLCLGRTSDGKNAGHIGFHVENLTAASFTPTALRYQIYAEDGSVDLHKVNGVVSEVYALDSDVKIETITDGFIVKFYSPVFNGTKFTNLISAWQFKRLSPNDDSQMEIKRTVGGSETYVFGQVNGAWSLARDGVIETVDNSIPNVEIRTIRGAGVNDPIVSKEKTTYDLGTAGQSRMIEQVLFSDLNTPAEITTWHYYPGSDRLEYVEYPNGSWRRYTYDTAGEIIQEIGPWLDSLRTDTNLANHHYYETTKDPITISGAPVTRETKVERIGGQEVGRTYKLIWNDPVAVSNPDSPSLATIDTRQVWEVQVRAPGLAWDAVGNYITKSNYDLWTEELWRTVEPDSTTTYQVHCRSLSGGYLTYEKVRGGSRPSTNTVRETNASGAVIFEETTDNVLENNAYLISIGHSIPVGEENLVSNRVLSSKIATDFENGDSNRGKPTAYVYLDGSSEAFTYSCCGRISYHLDRKGLEISYVYDSRGLLVEEIRGSNNNVYPYIQLGTNYNIYDAAGRLIQVDRAVSGYPGRAVQFQTAYDLAGRVISTKDALNRETTYTYASASGGGLVRSMIRQADGATMVDTTHRNGHAFTVSGTAIHPQKYLYGKNTLGQRWRQEIQIGASGSETEWVKTYVDMLGRVAKKEYPDGAASTYAYGTDTYGTVGATLGAYTMTDPDGDLTSGGTSDHYEIAERMLPLNFYGDVSVYVSVHRTTKNGTYTDISLDGLKTWITDPNGQTTTVETELANDPEAFINRTITTKTPDGASMVRDYAAGQVLTEIRKDSTGAIVSAVYYGYDMQGRLENLYRTEGTTSYSYYDDDQIASTTGPDPDSSRSGPGYDPQTTSYEYDDVGRQSIVTNPDGTKTFTTYWPTGEVKRSWGSRTYPNEYSYDTQGRVKTLTTWKDFTSQVGAAITTWNYHSQRGWLTSKVYEGNTVGPTYTYWPSGRLKTRTWARGVTATYAYNNVWGKLSGVSYSDGTPPVAYTYTTDGERLKTIQDTAGTLTYDYRISGVTIGDVVYYPEGSLSQETYAGGLLGGLFLSHNVDFLGRKGGSVAKLNGTPQVSTAWQYDTAGRLQTITQGQISATLAYEADTSALESISVKQASAVRLTTSRTIDAIRRISGVAFDNPSPGLLGNRVYTYDAANKRTLVEQEDTRRWAYGYDSLGQVNLAEKRLSNGNVLPGYAFAFDYDDIGNRESTTVNGHMSSYTSDALNRYISRSTPLLTDVRGKALSQVVNGIEQVKVLVNDELATRTAEDFYLAVPVTALSENSLKIQAVRPSPEQATTENRKILVPSAPEAFAYDTDGNLIQDGLWNYEWDGENRLKAQELRSDVASSSWKRLEYAYDGQGRRIQKVVKTKTSVNGAWTTASDTRFLYDGWNLIAEYSYSAGAFTLLRSHAWGLDLSESTQGAGGVGGLLWTTVAATGKTYAAGSDANGNVVLFVDCSDGTVAGRRDYGPFGEPILTTGIAAALPFGFSTKYEDKDTGLYYYGFRYYEPGAGKWLSRDPIDEKGGINLYGFVNNDPVDFTDYLGQSLSFAVPAFSTGQSVSFKGCVPVGTSPIWACFSGGWSIKIGNCCDAKTGAKRGYFNIGAIEVGVSFEIGAVRPFSASYRKPVVENLALCPSEGGSVSWNITFAARAGPLYGQARYSGKIFGKGAKGAKWSFSGALSYTHFTALDWAVSGGGGLSGNYVGLQDETFW